MAIKRVLPVACWLLLLSSIAFAPTATLSGTAKDQSGAVLPGVQITVANPATSFNRSVVTGERGDYVLPLLPVGRYDVTAELPGFKTETRQGIDLQVDQRLTINFDM